VDGQDALLPRKIFRDKDNEEKEEQDEVIIN
jgi:hypothetical protein